MKSGLDVMPLFLLDDLLTSLWKIHSAFILLHVLSKVSCPVHAHGYAEVVTEFLKNSAIICIISTGEVEKHQMNTIIFLYKMNAEWIFHKMLLVSRQSLHLNRASIGIQPILEQVFEKLLVKAIHGVVEGQ